MSGPRSCHAPTANVIKFVGDFYWLTVNVSSFLQQYRLIVNLPVYTHLNHVGNNMVLEWAKVREIRLAQEKCNENGLVKIFCLATGCQWPFLAIGCLLEDGASYLFTCKEFVILHPSATHFTSCTKDQLCVRFAPHKNWSSPGRGCIPHTISI